MASLPHHPSAEQLRQTIADVFGDRDATPTAAPQPDWPHAVAHVSDALCEKLRLAATSARLAKALELVLAQAVTLHEDGSASVHSGTRTYTLAPHCPCPDAKNRSEMCKHALAVELHRRALAVLDGTAHAPAVAPASVPAAPSGAPVPTAPTSSAWQVHEAPTSACFRFRLGQGELTYTFRGVNDLEVLDRIHEHLPFLQAIVDGWEQRVAERTAVRDAALAQAQTQQAPVPADMQALLQQMLQQALAAQSTSHTTTNGHANGHTPASPPRCPHHGAMRDSTKAPGTWFCAQKLADGSYCTHKA